MPSRYKRYFEGVRSRGGVRLYARAIYIFTEVHPGSIVSIKPLDNRSQLPNNISPAMLLELTRFTIKQWEAVAFGEKVVPA